MMRSMSRSGAREVGRLKQAAAYHGEITVRAGNIFVFDALVYVYDPFLLPSNTLTCLLLDGLGSAALDA